MLLYDWKKIFIHGNAKPIECFRIFEMMSKKSIPKNPYDPIFKYSHIDFSGESFLVHDDVLVYNAHKHTKKDICVYLSLASARRLSDYKLNRDTTLDLLLLPEDEVVYDEIEKNRLLHVEDGKLHFLYEEVPKEKKQWH